MHELATDGVRRNLGDDLTAALGASPFNEYMTVLGVFNRVEQPNVRRVADVAPGVLADGLLI